MKLARPDVRHPRIVLAGSRSVDNDDDGLVGALRKRGLHARWMRWDDPATVNADLVILRAAPDDAGLLDDFLAWTKRVPNVLNAPPVIEWNVDKRYLRDLQRAGVPTAATAAGPDTTALVFLGGVQSHAFIGRRLVDADFELWDVGHAALRAAAEKLGIDATELLCARADVTGRPDDARLVRLDLVAPSLGWRALDDADRSDQQRQFALCVESALERLGLGPLSHRRP
ncbi:ATP-grasp domain-containing protein [Mycobacterium noviomagense]|uniref:Uncharacterized protein n=1 Tax=Mycobacterium noviomagense TaxID=459858 RepID=A0A7I7PIQ6_9MYCO|nr:hypothetical protein [Mycobacterium noviomagense]ORB17423.1 hypothetical protein BST37_04395 [Mycobacterium noviomagense]BBY08425.1 hypothetical protein MNVI_37430 [Mycobacterium noviomagense]